MKNDKKQPIEEVKELTIVEPTNLEKPEQDTKFAHEAARFLVDIIKKNNWARRLGGQSEHIQYEGWQTAGKFYGYTVKTHDAQPIEIAGIQGFKAYATVVNEKTGIIVGGAEAYCMRDEGNWKTKPTFQLASMAQTRAGSKALRQILGFVVALAGYNPTPTEEMEGVYDHKETVKAAVGAQTTIPTNNQGSLISEKQLKFIDDLLIQKGISRSSFEEKIYGQSNGKNLNEITHDQASKIIEKLLAIPVKKRIQVKEEKEDINLDDVDRAIDSKQIYNSRH